MKGDLLKLSGRNHYFRFLYVHDNGDLTLWGPVTSKGQAKTNSRFVSVRKNEVK